MNPLLLFFQYFIRSAIFISLITLVISIIIIVFGCFLWVGFGGVVGLSFVVVLFAVVVFIVVFFLLVVLFRVGFVFVRILFWVVLFFVVFLFRVGLCFGFRFRVFAFLFRFFALILAGITVFGAQILGFFSFVVLRILGLVFRFLVWILTVGFLLIVFKFWGFLLVFLYHFRIFLADLRFIFVSVLVLVFRVLFTLKELLVPEYQIWLRTCGWFWLIFINSIWNRLYLLESNGF